MTVSNFKELWIAIQNNGKILTCWCCNHVIPSLYEKEYTNVHGYTDPSCTSSACALNKSRKKEIEPKRISDMVVRKRKILMIRILRLENRQSSVYCKFCIWSFLKSTKLYRASVPITEKNTSCFRGFSEAVGWEQLPEMVQSLAGFLGYRDFFDVVGQCKQIFRFSADLYEFSSAVRNVCSGTYILCIL